MLCVLHAMYIQFYAALLIMRTMIYLNLGNHERKPIMQRGSDPPPQSTKQMHNLFLII